MSKILPSADQKNPEAKLNAALASQVKQEVQDSEALQQTKDDIRDDVNKRAQELVDIGAAEIGRTGIGPVDKAVAGLDIRTVEEEAMRLAARLKNGDLSMDDLRLEAAKMLENAEGDGNELLQEWGHDQANKIQTMALDSIDAPGPFKVILQMALNVVTFGALTFDGNKEIEDKYPSGRGDKFFDQIGNLRRLLGLHIYLKGLMTSRRYFQRLAFWSVIILYLFSLFLAFPVPFIVTGEKGQVVSPADAVERWDNSLLLFFFILVLLPIGLFKTTVVVINVCQLGLHGYLWDQLGSGQSRTDGDENDGPAPLSTAQRIAKSRIESLTSINIYILVLTLCLTVLFTAAHYAVNKQGPLAIRLFIVLFIWISAFISLLSIFCLIVVILSLTELLKHNFLAYGETFSLLVKSIKLFSSAHDEKEHPLVENLYDKLLAQEQSILSVMTKLRITWMQDISYLYAVLATGYVCMVFYIFLAFLKLQVDFDAGLAFEAVSFTICTLISIIVVVQPLFAMAVQAEEWVRITASCQSSEVQNAYVQPNQGPFFWYEHHVKLQKRISWNILGYDMLFSVIISTVCSYFGVVWLGVIWPSIQKQMSKL